MSWSKVSDHTTWDAQSSGHWRKTEETVLHFINETCQCMMTVSEKQISDYILHSAPTCACNGSKYPTLSIADGTTFCPLAQNILTADPFCRTNSIIWYLSPISHQHTIVIITVDLWTQTEGKWGNKKKNDFWVGVLASKMFLGMFHNIGRPILSAQY